jgi:hypothetical protein
MKSPKTSVKKKRCPKGTRRDTSGACVPKEQGTQPKKSPKKHVTKRCPKGTRRDKTSGKCVSKLDTPKPKKPTKPKKKTLKPCKPGQERNPTTNRCRKIQTKTPKKPTKTETLSLKEDMKYQPNKVSPKPVETYFAKFYDISSEVDPKYETNGHLRKEMDNEQNITKIINKHPEFKRGDVLFVGSSYETRQEYGFVIYLPEEKAKYEDGEDGVSEPLDIVRRGNKYGEKKENPLEHVKYSKLINDFMADPPKGYDRELVGLFMGDDWRDEEEFEELVNDYKKEGLWD